jgi:hypothetical protein
MAESYQDIIARLSGTQQQEKPKAANDFASYVRTLLDNPSPRGSMFARQDEIDRMNQANLSNELEKKKVEEELTRIIKEASTGMFGDSGGGGDAPDSPNTGQSPIGIGTATDAIQSQALQDALMGFATGGIPVAIQSGLQSLASGTLGLLGQVNSSVDPIQALAIAQGWAPVEQVDLSTPFGGMIGLVSDGRGGFLGDIGGGSTIGNSGMGVNSAGQTVSNDATIAAQDAATFGGGFGGGGHDAGVTGGNSFGGNNADGGGYNE